jgi:PPOX class probable F420-dependent enzyme
VPVPLPDDLLDLLSRPSLCFVATIMPNGSPQLTQTWVTTDGVHILINTPDHSQKARNIARDPHVAVNIVDPSDNRHYFAVRGRVIATTTEGGAESIDELSGKYLGRPYPRFSGRPETRMIMTIEADSVRNVGPRLSASPTASGARTGSSWSRPSPERCGRSRGPAAPTTSGTGPTTCRPCPRRWPPAACRSPPGSEPVSQTGRRRS